MVQIPISHYIIIYHANISAFSYPILIDDFEIADTLIKNLEESWDDVKRENDIFIHDGKVKDCEGFYNWVEEEQTFC